MSLRTLNSRVAMRWTRLGSGFLPFADLATDTLPWSRLLRLSLFQVSVGMAITLLIGTLNRVMIVELGVPAWLVATMVSLPLVFAPLRAVIGFKSDTHRSVLGWRRVPYLWFGTLLQFGGFSIMPFALLILSGDTTGPLWVGHVAAALAFLLVGAGLHTVQTVGLALATDISPQEQHPKVVALLCMMMLLGMVVSGVWFGIALQAFTEIKLVQAIQGAAVLTVMLNAAALWKQEARNPQATAARQTPGFRDTWRQFNQGSQATRRLIALGLGTIAFSMQDILLEPYGGHVLGLSVGATTAMTAMLALGGLFGFGSAAVLLGRGMDPYRLAGSGALVGLVAFTCVIFAAPFHSVAFFAMGVFLIGLGAGLFAHCTLTAAMATAQRGHVGLTLGIWGAVQATAAGTAVAAGGLISDGVSHWVGNGTTGYVTVYTIEIALLFATLVAIGPLVRFAAPGRAHSSPLPTC